MREYGKNGARLLEKRECPAPVLIAKRIISGCTEDKPDLERLSAPEFHLGSLWRIPEYKSDVIHVEVLCRVLAIIVPYKKTVLPT
jgi:hypothetical protein